MTRICRLQTPRTQPEPMHHQIKAELKAGRAMQLLSQGVTGWAIDCATGELVDLVALQERLDPDSALKYVTPSHLEMLPQ